MSETKLTAEQRQEIVARYTAGESSIVLGREYHIAPNNIRALVKGHGGEIRNAARRPNLYGQQMGSARNVRYPADVLQAAGEYGESVGAYGSVAPGLRHFARLGMEAWRKEQAANHDNQA